MSSPDFQNDYPSHKSDVLIDYESDIIQAKRLGAPITLIDPPDTLLIENPLAVVQTSKNLPAAQAFVSFLLSKTGQTDWAKLGYRSVLPSVEAKFRKTFPDPKGLFKIGFLGGWDSVTTTYFSTSTSSRRDRDQDRRATRSLDIQLATNVPGGRPPRRGQTH